MVNLYKDESANKNLFLMGHPWPFLFLFGLFKQTVVQISNKLMWKMSIQYPTMEFELPNSSKFVFSHNQYTRAPAQTNTHFIDYLIG